MTRRIRTTFGTTTLGAAILAAAMAPTASAAPADVTATSSVSGSVITLTVKNSAAKRIGCEIFGVPADAKPSADQVKFGYQTPEELSALIVPGSTKNLEMRLSVGTPPRPAGSTTIPDGSYDVYWGCGTISLPPGDPAAEEYWGTNPPLGNKPATATTPLRVDVPGTTSTEPSTPAPAPTAPGGPKTICIAGFCLPLP
ncbi:hypothetical protein QSJ19_05775 [Gordonia sp. ABSL11-1]|uniref:hypothetical protein n=1 Tax=Gordonia sp. ABSL11-1 TaxID=3053924 RepID=UPI002573122E|nr:hypothetical protein [Gordonia sp. ABSL11-1]MDL9945104.1 hypothetical protein [Gordonia sp. ABSL11-1]